MRDEFRDWPILLAQRMRESRWVNAQIALIGSVECKSPDQLQVLNVGGRYEVNHKHVRAARAHLSAADRNAITAYLLRDDEYVKRTDEDGNNYWATHAPEMKDDEATAWRHLWHALADAGHVERKPPRPPRPQPDEPTTAPATE